MRVASFLLLMLLASCQSLDTTDSSLTPEESAVLIKAVNYIEKKNFKKAARLYDALIQNTSNEKMEPLLLFNAGSVYRELKDCGTSIRRYRQILEDALDKKKFKARALLEISYSYECAGKNKLSFFSLKDLGSLRQNLSLPINIAVYPARLGIAYLYMGKPLRADQYKSLALNGILQLKPKYTSEKRLNQELSSLFYSMGRSYVNPDKMNAQMFVQAFPHHHFYLWQALFIKDPKWYPIAKTELLSLYDKLKVALKNKKISAHHKKSAKQSFKDIEVFIKKEKDHQFKKLFYKNKIL